MCTIINIRVGFGQCTSFFPMPVLEKRETGHLKSDILVRIESDNKYSPLFHQQRGREYEFVLIRKSGIMEHLLQKMKWSIM